MMEHSYPDLSEINDLDKNGETLLFNSLRNGDFDIFKYIIDLEMSNLTHVNNNGENILDVANKINSTDDFLDLINSINILSYNINKIPIYKKEYSHSYELERILFEDDIAMFKNEFSSYKESVFALACKYDSNKIAKFCIDKNFGLNASLDGTLTKGLSFAFFNENIYIVDMLMDILTKNEINTKDGNNKIPISYAISPVFNRTKIKILNLDDDIVDNSTDFKIFTTNDFTFVNGFEAASGSYGSIINVIDKESGKPMVIKKYKSRTSHPVLDQSTSVEISLLRWINKINPNMCVKIYGIYIEDGAVHLVQESLKYTLNEFIKIIMSLNDSEFSYYFRKIFFNLLVNINFINGLGIAHLDIKKANIMVDDNGRFKIIDFGLSEFLGISPNPLFVSNIVTTSFVNPSYRDYVNYKTLNVDVFSVGVTMMNTLYQRNNKVGINRGSDRFIYDNKRDMLVLPKVYTNRYNKVLKFDDFDTDFSFIQNPDLKDLFIRTLSLDADKRWFADDCLKHKYFTNNNYSPEVKNVQLTQMNKYTYYSEWNRELHYFDSIFENNKNLKFSQVDTFDIEGKENAVMTVSDWLLAIDRRQYSPVDVFVNAIPFYRHILQKEIENDDVIILCILCYYYFNLSGEHLPDHKMSIDDILRYVNNSHKHEDRERDRVRIIKLMKEMVLDLGNFNMVNVNSMVKHLVVLLQKKGLPKDEIFATEKYVNSRLKLWVIYNNKYNLTIWEIICGIYNTYEHVKFSIDSNNEHNEIVISVIPLKSKLSSVQNLIDNL